ncbi:hypothetical protein [Rhizobium leguminosarum]|uniref:hypothetical protein n=1 Tax=Rhizobium leguminosarum TaxID=384 RepID=UPI002E1234F8|nr:hypothetical protein U8Q02_39830 [Rhizobium leguminosarum]
MPIELTHKNVRDLAKNLREKVGRDDIKHSDVISAIAASVGRRPDAMMHELKNEKPGAPAERPHLEVCDMGERAGLHLVFNEESETWLMAVGTRSSGSPFTPRTVVAVRQTIRRPTGPGRSTSSCSTRKPPCFRRSVAVR